MFQEKLDEWLEGKAKNDLVRPSELSIGWLIEFCAFLDRAAELPRGADESIQTEPCKHKWLFQYNKDKSYIKYCGKCGVRFS